MSNHLSNATLNALADGELTADELVPVTEHLHDCPACTSRTLEQSLLKSATARAGQRYALPDDVRRRMERLVLSQNASRGDAREKPASPQPMTGRRAVWAGWAVAAALLIAAIGLTVTEMRGRQAQMAQTARAALVTEVSDQYFATLAADLPPQVLSSDRHTVKPWFEGKIPFSFNLPDGLPPDTKLDGANLAYLGNRPVAQLLYSIGKHRVSVFVQERTGGTEWGGLTTDHAGLHLAGFSTKELDVVAISDVDPAKLAGLLELVQSAQSK